MNLIKKRLDRLEGQMAPDVRYLLVFTKDTDPPGTLEDMIKRWKAGEAVSGVGRPNSAGEPYDGRPFRVINVRIVSKPQTEAAKAIWGATA